MLEKKKKGQAWGRERRVKSPRLSAPLLERPLGSGEGPSPWWQHYCRRGMNTLGFLWILGQRGKQRDGVRRGRQGDLFVTLTKMDVLYNPCITCCCSSSTWVSAGLPQVRNGEGNPSEVPGLRFLGPKGPEGFQNESGGCFVHQGPQEWLRPVLVTGFQT